MTTALAYQLDQAGPHASSPSGQPLLGTPDDASMSVPCIISTGDQDRQGDIVQPVGCVWEHYARAPVVFLNHQKNERYPLPIGKAQGPDGACTIKVAPERITSVTYFSQGTSDGVNAYILTKEGILCGVSIGFNPLDEPEPLPWKSGQTKRGHRFSRWELLEYSHCGVAVNPHCTIIRSYLEKGKVPGGDRLSPAFRKSLGVLAEEAPEQVTGGLDMSTGLAVKKEMPPAPPGAAPAQPQQPGMEEPPDQAGQEEEEKPEPEEKRQLHDILGELTKLLMELSQMAGPNKPGEDEEEEPDEDLDEEDNEEDLARDEKKIAGDKDEDEDEDLMQRYRSTPRVAKVLKRLVRAVRKDMTEGNGKDGGYTLNPDHVKCMKSACAHMKDLSEMEPGTKWTGMHRDSCAHHAGKLESVMKDMEEPGPGPQTESMQPDEATSSEEVAGAVKSSIAAALGPISETIFRITGKRVS
jgi:hypothetical protein